MKKSAAKQVKITKVLAERVNPAKQSDVVEVVVELGDKYKTQAGAKTSAVSRSAMIAQRKKSFDQVSSPVEAAISEAGGVVTERAWINGTLLAMLPVGSLEKISALDEVASLDTPHKLEPDTSRV